MTSYKLDRISSDILKYLNNIILTESRDNILKTITLTEIKISKDLGYAKIFFTSISDLNHEEIEKEVNNASPFLRRELAKVIEIRNVPKLHFVYDEQLDNIEKLESILTSIHKDDNEK